MVNVRGAADPDKDGLVQARGRGSCCRWGNASNIAQTACL